MKHAKSILFTFVLLALVSTFGHLSHASFMASCQLEAKVLQAQSVKGFWNPVVPATLHITKVLHQSGHTNNYCTYYNGFKGRGFRVKLRIKNRAQKKHIQKGKYIIVNYRYSNGYSSKGSWQNKSWTFYKTTTASKASKITPKQKIVKAFRPYMKLAKSGKTFVIGLNSATTQKGFTIQCPIGIICDEKFSYRMYKFARKNLHIQLSFSAAIVGKLSLKTIKKHFSYISVRMKPLPGLSFPGWRITGNRYNKVFYRMYLGENVKIDGYTKGRIQGEIVFTLNQIKAVNTEPPCAPHFTQPTKSGACLVKTTTPIKIKILFDLPLQKGILDCKKLPRPTQCG